jgi:hypothetical protein
MLVSVSVGKRNELRRGFPFLKLDDSDFIPACWFYTQDGVGKDPQFIEAATGLSLSGILNIDWRQWCMQ